MVIFKKKFGMNAEKKIGIRRESNLRPTAYHAQVLPLHYEGTQC